MDNAVCGKNHEAAALHGNERHHYKFVRCIRIGTARRCAALVSIGQRCFVAVMPIRNQELFVLHLLLHRMDKCGLMNSPDPVQGFVLVQQRNVRVFVHAGFEQGFNLMGRIAIKHKDLPKMGPSGS